MSLAYVSRWAFRTLDANPGDSPNLTQYLKFIQQSQLRDAIAAVAVYGGSIPDSLAAYFNANIGCNIRGVTDKRILKRLLKAGKIKLVTNVDCVRCSGTGMSWGAQCDVCSGTKKADVYTWIAPTIPD